MNPDSKSDSGLTKGTNIESICAEVDKMTSKVKTRNTMRAMQSKRNSSKPKSTTSDIK